MKLEIYGNTKDGFKGHGDSDGGEHLEPCPFCGSLDIKVHNTHTPSYWTECDNCGAQGPHTIYPKREARSKAGVRRQHLAVFDQAVGLWNERAA